jgi:hypothetical protein
MSYLATNPPMPEMKGRQIFVSLAEKKMKQVLDFVENVGLNFKQFRFCKAEMEVHHRL